MGGGRQGVLGAFEGLDDVFFPEKGVERTPDIGVVFDHNNALIFDLARHGIKISRDAIISRRI